MDQTRCTSIYQSINLFKVV